MEKNPPLNPISQYSPEDERRLEDNIDNMTMVHVTDCGMARRVAQLLPVREIDGHGRSLLPHGRQLQGRHLHDLSGSGSVGVLLEVPERVPQVLSSPEHDEGRWRFPLC